MTMERDRRCDAGAGPDNREPPPALGRRTLEVANLASTDMTVMGRHANGRARLDCSRRPGRGLRTAGRRRRRHRAPRADRAPERPQALGVTPLDDPLSCTAAPCNLRRAARLEPHRDRIVSEVDRRTGRRRARMLPGDRRGGPRLRRDRGAAARVRGSPHAPAARSAGGDAVNTLARSAAASFSGPACEQPARAAASPPGVQAGFRGTAPPPRARPSPRTSSAPPSERSSRSRPASHRSSTRPDA